VGLNDAVLLFDRAHTTHLAVIRKFAAVGADGDGDELIPRVPLEGAGAVAGEIAIRVNGSTSVAVQTGAVWSQLSKLRCRRKYDALPMKSLVLAIVHQIKPVRVKNGEFEICRHITYRQTKVVAIGLPRTRLSRYW